MTVSAHSSGAYIATLYVMVTISERGWSCSVHRPPPSPAWANFTLMMECTPESGRCHSVCTLWIPVSKIQPFNDAIKLFSKEIVFPLSANNLVYLIRPAKNHGMSVLQVL